MLVLLSMRVVLEHEVVAMNTAENEKSRRGPIPRVLDHVGLLVNGPPGPAGLAFI
jgi:hypothetical protein